METVQEKENELLAYLSSLGFRGEKLEQDIRQQIELNLPAFSVKYKIAKGEEAMLYELRFKKDHQFDAYRLEQYKATHRDALAVNHKPINGINTAELEVRMKGWDWDTYFKSPEKITSNEAKSFINETIIQLNALSEGQNFDGIKIQEELMFKYWPVDAYSTAVNEDFKQLYEHNRKFSATEFGICNANLAYYIVSGKLERLHEKLNSMNLDEYPGMELHMTLEQILSNDPDSFELNGSFNTPEGFIEFKVPVSRIDGEFELENYHASYAPYPDIIHGCYNGIETARLEALMAAIDWHNDAELFIFKEESEPDFLPDVAEVRNQVYRLSQHPEGAAIADLLQLKYWTDVTFFGDDLHQSAWDLFESLPKIQQEFPCEIEARIAFNLLCGRAVMEHLVLPVFPESSDWLRLDTSHKSNEGNYPLVMAGSLSKTELTELLQMIPLADKHYRDIPSLMKGEHYEAKIANGNTVFLEVNPEQKTIDLFTPSKKLIPVNIHCDPDWQGHQASLEKIRQMEPDVKKSKSTQRIFLKKRKGTRI